MSWEQKPSGYSALYLQKELLVMQIVPVLIAVCFNVKVYIICYGT